MIHSPLSLTRRHVLGDLYSRCENVVSIPVYLNDPEGEMIGYVDEGLGHYADAFCFHLPEDICKKLATGHFECSFNYTPVDGAADNGKKGRINLTNICLTGRKTADAIGPRVKRAAATVE